jgi:carbon-monoxide dehydrogenase small subunit
MTRISITVNGERCHLEVPADSFLLEVLRERVGLTGAKGSCLEGECGACTVIVDGMAVTSCLILAAEVDNAEIITVEGLAGEGLSRLQRAFLDHGAAQCGFCIPGQLAAAQALLDSNPAPTREEIREAVAGNLCRCGAYEQIADAVLAAAEATS